jgi:hypothetical protein
LRVRQHAAGVDLGRDAGELCLVAQLHQALGDAVGRADDALLALHLGIG